MAPALPGLRERKKNRTRDAIHGAAMGLFLEHGFEETTIAQIADAADIAPRTFFGYFPTKEDVVFHRDAEALDSLVARIRDREPGEDPFDALRAWIVAFEAARPFDEPGERARRRLIRETPALTTRERADRARVEDVLAEAVAHDLGVEPDSLRPRLVAAAAVAALEALGRLHDCDDDAVRSGADVLDEALVFLQGGLEALRLRPGG